MRFTRPKSLLSRQEGLNWRKPPPWGSRARPDLWDEILRLGATWGYNRVHCPQRGTPDRLRPIGRSTVFAAPSGSGTAMQLRSQRPEPSPSASLLPAFAGGWGPAAHEARSAYFRARQAGMNSLRSLVVSFVASFKDCWAFRRQIAQIIGCSVRTCLLYTS